MTITTHKQYTDYYFTVVQFDLFRILDDYVKKFDNIEEAAKSLNMSRKDLLLCFNGDMPESIKLYDFIGLAIRLGYKPVITLKKIDYDDNQ